MKTLLIAALSWMLPFITSTRAGESFLFQSSPEKTVMLVEVFSSQGCSSCPPADDWISQLSESPGLWKDFVPVVWHVDYWDRLGWVDPFASTGNSQRQYDYQKGGQLRSVYTPGFVVDGREWRGWFDQDPLPTTTQKESPVGELSVAVNQGAEIEITVGKSVARELVAHATLLGSGLVTKVTSGENQGKTLRQDFVVLGYRTGAVKDGKATLKVPESRLGESAAQTRLALAVWITEKGNSSPLQAAGAWIP